MESEEHFRKQFEHMVWPNGPICPWCSSKRFYFLTPKKESSSPVRVGVYKCAECRKQYTPKHNTPFYGCKEPYTKIYSVIDAVIRNPEITLERIMRMIRVTNKTAYYFKFRAVQLLSTCNSRNK